MADLPPALTWFANIDTLQTCHAYQAGLKEFMAFTRIDHPEQPRLVT